MSGGPSEEPVPKEFKEASAKDTAAEPVPKGLQEASTKDTAAKGSGDDVTNDLIRKAISDAIVGVVTAPGKISSGLGKLMPSNKGSKDPVASSPSPESPASAAAPSPAPMSMGGMSGTTVGAGGGKPNEQQMDMASAVAKTGVLGPEAVPAAMAYDKMKPAMQSGQSDKEKQKNPSFGM